MERVRFYRPSKYHNKRTQCLSHWHASQLEAKHCGEFRLQKLAGEIKDYEIQRRVRLVLDECYVGTMIVDFYVHENDGSFTFAETKGMELAKWKKDWRILQHIYKNDPTHKFLVLKR